MPELGAGKQFILLSWRLDTLSGKCCNRDMGTQVRETSFNLRKRKEEGEKVGVAGGEEGILHRRKNKHRRLQGLRAHTSQSANCMQIRISDVKELMGVEVT